MYMSGQRLLTGTNGNSFFPDLLLCLFTLQVIVVRHCLLLVLGDPSNKRSGAGFTKVLVSGQINWLAPELVSHR